MNDTISICLTNFNREQMLYESIAQVIDDERISEVIISDDCSDYALYRRVCAYYEKWPKVKVSRTDTNIDCFRNKRRAVSLATNDWVLILDSDNIITTRFIDIFWCQHKLFGGEWVSRQIYAPSFAAPHFDFRNWTGIFHKGNMRKAIMDSSFQTLLNAMNYFVNRDEYLRVWDGSIDPVTSDSIWQNYCWLRAGNSIKVCQGLEYQHRIHNGSHYQNNVRRTKPGLHQEIVNKLKALR